MRRSRRGVGAVDGCGVRWRDGDERAWLQIDLGRELVVSAIGTQGSETLQTYVTDYDASFSNDGVHCVTPFLRMWFNNLHTYSAVRSERKVHDALM